MTRVRSSRGELSSRLVHPACPTGGSAILALIAAVWTWCSPLQRSRNLPACLGKSTGPSCGCARQRPILARSRQPPRKWACANGAARRLLCKRRPSSESSRARTRAHAFCGEAGASESSQARPRAHAAFCAGAGPSESSGARTSPHAAFCG